MFPLTLLGCAILVDHDVFAMGHTLVVNLAILDTTLVRFVHARQSDRTLYGIIAL